MFRATCLVLCLCALVASRSLLKEEFEDPQSNDLEFLLEDVEHIWLSGNPGWFTVFGAHAFPVVAAKTSTGLYRTLIAGARYGKGRIFAAAHSSFLSTLTPPAPNDRDQLLLNAVNWLSPGQRAKTIATVGTLPPAVNSIFDSKGIEVYDISWSDIADTRFIKDFDALLLRGNIPPDVVPHLLSYLELDRGLLISSTPMSVPCCNDGEHFASAYSNNVITSKAGFVWGHSGGSIPTTPLKTYNTSVEYLQYLHFIDAIKLIDDQIQGKVEAERDSLKQGMEVVWDVRNMIL